MALVVMLGVVGVGGRLRAVKTELCGVSWSRAG